MLVNPRVGQVVRHYGFNETMLVKSVEPNGIVVEFCLASNEDKGYPDMPIIMFFPASELYLS